MPEQIVILLITSESFFESITSISVLPWVWHLCIYCALVYGSHFPVYVLSNFELYFGLLNIVLCFQAYYNPLGNVCAFVLEENWKFCFTFSLACSSLSYVGSGLSSVCARLCQDLWGAHTEFSSVQLSRSVVSNSLQPHGLQHARLPCSSPTPGAYSNSCPLSRWCHPTISSSCRPLLLLPSIFPSISIFSSESVLHIRWRKCWSFSFSIGPSNEYSGLISFRMDWSDLLAVQGSLMSPPTLQFKIINSSVLSFLYDPTFTSIHDYQKNQLDRSLSAKSSLLFNTLSRFVIAFLQGPTVF